MAQKRGRPVSKPTPKTSLAKRLQSILPDVNLSSIGNKFLGGKQAGTIQRYLSGERQPPLEVLVAASKATGCSLDWLITGKEPDEFVEATGGANRVNLIIPVGRAAADTSNGTHADLNAEGIEPRSMPMNPAYFEVEGDSMSPVAFHGQLVEVDLEGEWEDGGLCVVVIRKGKYKGTMFKRVHRTDGHIVLNSVNTHMAIAPIILKEHDTDIYPVTAIRL